jgi:hypothetical protein
VDLVTIIQHYKRMQKLLSSNVLFLAGLLGLRQLGCASDGRARCARGC